jgi:hypothetical protein
MAVIVIGIGVSAVVGVIGGIGAANEAKENRKMQEKFLEQQNKAREEDRQLMMLMMQQGNQRQAQTAQFLTQSGYGDIANLMGGNSGQGQGQVQGQFPQGQMPNNYSI